VPRKSEAVAERGAKNDANEAMAGQNDLVSYKI
jgi:hypothetical protein